MFTTQVPKDKNPRAVEYGESLRKKYTWFTYLSSHIYQILFSFGAVVLIYGFIKLMVKRRAYRDEEEEEDGEEEENEEEGSEAEEEELLQGVSGPNASGNYIITLPVTKAEFEVKQISANPFGIFGELYVVILNELKPPGIERFMQNHDEF